MRPRRWGVATPRAWPRGSSEWRPPRSGPRLHGGTLPIADRSLYGRGDGGACSHPTRGAPDAAAGTARQLSCLKALADQRGQSFAYPNTPADAGREIRRLKNARPDSHADRRRECEAIAGPVIVGVAAEFKRAKRKLHARVEVLAVKSDLGLA
jgi:hypothetical protein